ncbi:aldose 1-epimerase family protein [Roseomonas sp. GC11]|uniref:aldose epimerase family protein n=1 Tax=Roseomonas sp. GC11 TaxID=2950546 RepID=UPI0021093827|nr:aldose 1-epimerase family protein [Roseomonas sp. GC11]
MTGPAAGGTTPGMLTLRRHDARLTLSPLGAEMRSWRAAGREWLWPGDARWWARSAPVLFPIVGWARDGVIRHGAHSYPMGVHGFAAARRFRLAGQGESWARLVLEDDAESRAAFPFAFRLGVEYRLSARGVAVALRIANPGVEALPYAVGLHPGFLWDPAAEGHAALFSREEVPEVPVIAPGGLFSARRRAVPLRERRLPLSGALLAEEALCFLNLRSRVLRFANAGRGMIEMRLWNFPHLALWSPAGAPFLCLEAWTGHGDPEGFTGKLADKPSMRWLPPGGRAWHRVAFRLHPAGPGLPAG